MFKLHSWSIRISWLVRLVPMLMLVLILADAAAAEVNAETQRESLSNALMINHNVEQSEIIRLTCEATPELRTALIKQAEGHSSEGILPVTRWLAVTEGAQVEANVVDLSTEPVVAPDATYDRSTSSSLVSIRPMGVMRGVRIEAVTVFPLIKDGQGQVSAVTHAEIELRLTGGSSADGRPLKPSSSSFVEMASHLIIMSGYPARDDSVSAGGACLYLIPDNDAVAAAMSPLIEWRRRTGLRTELTRVASNSQALRNAISEAYQDADFCPEYVTVVGDAEGDFSLEPFESNNQFVSDFGYCLVDGDDVLPDLAVGRLSFNNIDELNRIVGKIITYERNPLQVNNGWLGRGLSATATMDMSSTTIPLVNWVRTHLLTAGFATVETTYGGQFYNFTRQRMQNGIGIFATRSMNGWNVNNIRELPQSQMTPFVLMTINSVGRFHQDDCEAEAMLQCAGGGVAVVGGGYDYLPTAYANLFHAALIYALTDEHTTELGWALNRGRCELARQYAGLTDDPFPPGGEWWEGTAKMFNLLGDPATRLWMGIPGQMRLECEHVLNIGENLFTGRVTDQDGGAPIAGARVCVYQPGQVMVVSVTDEGGQVRLVLPQDQFGEGEIFLTVSCVGYASILENLERRQRDILFGVHQFSIDDERGDDDGQADCGEQISLSIDIRNFGSQSPEGPLSARLTSDSEHLSVPEDPQRLASVPDPGASVSTAVACQVSCNCRDKETALIAVDVLADQQVIGHSVFELTLHAPLLEMIEAVYPDTGLSPSLVSEVSLVFRNNGLQAQEAFSAELASLSRLVQVISGVTTYPTIAVGEEAAQSGDAFVLRPRSDAIPGMNVPMELRLETESGRRDTARFAITLTAPAPGDPFGPDSYGYACFNSQGPNGDEKPSFEWIEIDSRLGGGGTNTGISNWFRSNNHSVVVNLPFPLVYYGRAFNSLTICSNGWVAPGDQRDFVDYRNRMLPSPLGTDGKICVFWDNLTGSDQSGIFYSHQAEAGLFIVEWSSMFRTLNNNQRGDPETFQLIIYNPQVHPTITGDCRLKYQYLEVHNAAEGWSYDTPYATVGIQGFNPGEALLYTYWNQYPPGATELVNETAISFSTNYAYPIGFLMGSVVDFTTSEPIPNVEVSIDNRPPTLTAEDGVFAFLDLAAPQTVSLRARRTGFNEWFAAEIEVPEDTVRVEIRLTHPEFALSVDSIAVDSEPEEEHDLDFEIMNQGNGPLHYTTRIDVLPNQPRRDDQWDSLFEVNITEATGDPNIFCATWVDDRFLAAGANSDGDTRMFYEFDRQGHLTGSRPQLYPSVQGALDMCFDGSWLWIHGSLGVMAFNRDGNVRVQFDVDTEGSYGIAVNPEGGQVFVAGVGFNHQPAVGIYDRQGHLSRTLNLTDPVYGLAYYADDSTGFPLYYATPEAGSPGRINIGQINVQTGEFRRCRQISMDPSSRPGGLDITRMWRANYSALLALVQHPRGDRLMALELQERDTWLAMTPSDGELAGGETQVFQLHFNAAYASGGRNQAEIVFYHNALGESAMLPVAIILPPDTNVVSEAPMPSTTIIGECYPMPFNAQTNLEYYLGSAAMVQLSVYDLSGRNAIKTQEQSYPAGWHTAVIDGANLSAGIYILQCRAGQEIALRKVVLIK